MIDRKRADILPTGHRLDSLRIARVLGAGVTGITYLAEEGALGRQVAVKEYFPAGLALRRGGLAGVAAKDAASRAAFERGLAEFRSQARALVAVEHANLGRAERLVETGGTAYLVSPFVGGESLAAVLGRRGVLTETELGDLLAPLLDGLAALHAAGLTHRDVKPANILLRNGGAPILVDAGVARRVAPQPLGPVPAQPYAAIELHGEAQAVGPPADLYALGAVLYRGVAGFHPPAAFERRGALRRGRTDPYRPAAAAAARAFAPAILSAIDACLAVEAAGRPQSIAALRVRLAGGLQLAASAPGDETLAAASLPPRAGLAIPPSPRPPAPATLSPAPARRIPAGGSRLTTLRRGAVVALSIAVTAGFSYGVLRLVESRQGHVDGAAVAREQAEFSRQVFAVETELRRAAEQAEQERRRAEALRKREAEMAAARALEAELRAAIEAAGRADLERQRAAAEQERLRREAEAARTERERRETEEAMRLAAELRAAVETALHRDDLRRTAEAEAAERARRETEEAMRLAAELRNAIDTALREDQRRRQEEVLRLDEERRAREEALRLEADLRAAVEAAWRRDQQRRAAEVQRFEEERRAAEEALQRAEAEAAERAERDRRQAEREAARRAAEERRKTEALAALFRHIDEAIGARDWPSMNRLLGEADALAPDDARVADLRGKIIAIAAEMVARADEARERGEWPEAERLLGEASRVVPGSRMVEAGRSRYERALAAWRDDRARLIEAARQFLARSLDAIGAGDLAAAKDRLGDAEEALAGFAADLPEQAQLAEVRRRLARAREDAEFARLRLADETRYDATRGKADALFAEAQRAALQRGGAAKACALFRDAGEIGHVGAQNQLGLCFATGRGAGRDDGEAYAWFRRAAEGGNAVAQFNLANAYLQGLGTERDPALGYAWARKSADQGYPKAFCRLGLLYRDGIGIDREREAAAAWFRRGADAGEGWCMALLGEAFQHGLGVERNRALARQLYDRAARAGYAAAREKLRDLR
jgi:TPR repeat protein/serine/threonine protein kinase